MEYPFKDLMPLDEATARDGYYKDWTHLDPEVFYSLTQISEYIKTKGYGVDVRLLIAQLAEHFGLKTTQVVDLANEILNVSNDLTDRFNQQIGALTEDSEVIDARGGKTTLGQRLDETEAQLAQTAKIINIKAFENEVINNNWSSVIQREINNNPFATIYFPRGEYRITSEINVPHTVYIKGEHKDLTTIISELDINFIALKDKVGLENITFKVNSLTHTKSVIRYFTKQGGNKNGYVRDIYITGLDGYSNRTKAIELVGDPAGTNENRSFFFFWTFEDIFVEFCDTAWYTEMDFSTNWSTAVTFKNLIVERTKRGVWFNTPFVAGYFSRYDFIGLQFQCNAKMERAFEAPADRSVIDIHIWDRAFFENKPKSIKLIGNGRYNTFNIRNVTESEVEVDNPSALYKNDFVFSDGTKQKNILQGGYVYVDSVNGSDSTGNGSQSAPFRTLTKVISELPLHITKDSFVINLADGTYNESINLVGFSGTGALTIQGSSNAILAGYIKVDRTQLNVTIKNITITGNNGGIAVYLFKSSPVYMDNVNIEPTTSNDHGIWSEFTKLMVRNGNIVNSGNALNCNTVSQFRVDSMTGSGNTVGLLATNGGIAGYTVGLPSEFATTNYKAQTGGLIIPNGGVILT